MKVPQRDAIRQTMLAMVAGRAPGRTVCPSEIARALVGNEEKLWRLLMAPIRAEAVELARSGAIAIYRKGKPADPGAFKGIYRLGGPSETRE